MTTPAHHLLTAGDRRRRGRGSVLVELALVLPLLILLVLAVVEFAQAIAAYKVVVNQVRIASRYLSTRGPGLGHAEARCLLTHGQAVGAAACPGTPLMPGFEGGQFSVAVADATTHPTTHRAQRTSGDATITTATTINLVTVTASGYQHRLNFGGLLTGIAGASPTISFSTVSSTMRQVN